MRWIGSWELIDADYHFWSGLAMRSCCAALGTMSSHLRWSMIMGEKRRYTCMCDWVTMLYSRKKIMYWGNKKNELRSGIMLYTFAAFKNTINSETYFIFGIL